MSMIAYVACVFLSSKDRARDTRSDEIVALKKIRMENEKDGKYNLPEALNQTRGNNY